MDKIAQCAKFITAIAGAGVTSALQFAPAGSTDFKYLTITSAVVTAIAVYFVPNAAVPAGGRHVDRGPTA